jgi:prepilin signal peptidase PulO-like enzyme (type II secretory pathway)
VTDTLSKPNIVPPAPAATVKTRLGEELPIFCEKCGYSLHGLSPVRCEQCAILQFHCPECGNHQPINTLRPAFQRILGRGRAWVVGATIVARVAFFVMMLFFWFIMGVEWSYGYNYGNGTRELFRISLEAVFGFALFAIPFAAVARMMLLRWRRGLAVGLILGAVVVLIVSLGAWTHQLEARSGVRNGDSYINYDFRIILLMTFAMISLSSTAAWTVWVGIVRLFLRRPVADALLDWQQGLSQPASKLARE